LLPLKAVASVTTPFGITAKTKPSSLLPINAAASVIDTLDKTVKPNPLLPAPEYWEWQ
jgi:hypothetical protein